jgi:RNA polymerase sigma factor (sigma-70 family)
MGQLPHPAVPIPQRKRLNMATASLTMPEQASTNPKRTAVSDSDFTALYQKQFSRLVGWFSKRTSFSSGDRRRDIAEDLAQDTFTKLYASDFRGDCSLQTWLYRIADSILKDWHKKKKASPLEQAVRSGTPTDVLVDDGATTEALSWEAALLDTKPNPEEALIQKEQKYVFQDPRLCELPEQTKRILFDKFVDNLSVDEIAEDHNLSVPAVYKRIERAMSKKRPSESSI